MANYYSHFFIEPPIPTKDMTPLEDLVLSAMFMADQEGELTSFLADGAVNTMPEMSTADLKRGLEDSRSMGTPLFDLVEAQLKAEEGYGDPTLSLNLDLMTWESIFQPIIVRSSTLTYVTMKGVFTCSKMQSEGYGAEITLITASSISTKSLDMIRTGMIEDMQAQGLIPREDRLPPLPNDVGAS